MNEFTITGRLISAESKVSNSGKPYGIVNVETDHNNKPYIIQMVVFGKISERLSDLIENSQVIARGHITSESKSYNGQFYFKISLVCDKIQYLEQ